MNNTPCDIESIHEGASPLRVSRKWLELTVYTVMSAVNIIYLKEALSLPESPRGVGAGGFPLLVSILIGVFLAGLILVSLLTKPRDEADKFILVSRPFSVALVIAAMLTVVAFLSWAGPLFGIALLALILMWLGGERRYKLLAILPPLLSFGIYVLFVLILGVYFD